MVSTKIVNSVGVSWVDSNHANLRVQIIPGERNNVVHVDFGRKAEVYKRAA